MTAKRRATTLVLAAALMAGPPIGAGTGAAELSLDRAAVLGLLDAALPEPVRVEVAGMAATLALDAVSALAFRDGGVEATVRARVAELDWVAPVRVRWVPEVGRLDGVVRLRPESAVPDLRLPVAVDLAAVLPAAELPRRVDLGLDGPAGRALDVVCVVHGVDVEDERLVVRLGLVTRAVRPREAETAAGAQGVP